MISSTRHIPLFQSGSGWPRLVRLYLSARGMARSLALVIGVSALYGVTRQWVSFDPEGGWGDAEVVKQLVALQAIPALLAGVVGASAWSPFGEPERTAASPLPKLRLLHLGLLLAMATILSWAFVAGWPVRMPEVSLPFVAFRNLLGMTGAALLVGRFADARFSWLLPVAIAVVASFRAFTVSADAAWTPPVWAWSGQASGAASSWVIAGVLFLVGGVLVVRDGARDTGDDAE